MLRTPECLDDRSAYGLAMGTLEPTVSSQAREHTLREWLAAAPRTWQEVVDAAIAEATEIGAAPLAAEITKWAATLPR